MRVVPNMADEHGQVPSKPENTMKITLKLFASLGNFLPPNAKRNQINIEVDDGRSVKDVLSAHNVPMEVCHLILVNGVFAPPAQSGDRILVDGDSLAVWPPVAGG